LGHALPFLFSLHFHLVVLNNTLRCLQIFETMHICNYSYMYFVAKFEMQIHYI
jgi:hypothetical protein